jgi:hypothetical protein
MTESVSKKLQTIKEGVDAIREKLGVDNSVLITDLASKIRSGENITGLYEVKEIPDNSIGVDGDIAIVYSRETYPFDTYSSSYFGSPKDLVIDNNISYNGSTQSDGANYYFQSDDGNSKAEFVYSSIDNKYTLTITDPSFESKSYDYIFDDNMWNYVCSDFTQLVANFTNEITQNGGTITNTWMFNVGCPTGRYNYTATYKKQNDVWGTPTHKEGDILTSWMYIDYSGIYSLQASANSLTYDENGTKINVSFYNNSSNELINIDLKITLNDAWGNLIKQIDVEQEYNIASNEALSLEFNLGEEDYTKNASILITSEYSTNA